MMSPSEWESLKEEIRSLRVAVDELKRFQNWVLGAVAATGALIAFMADTIKKRIGL